jgi:ribonucleotide monophosphatase NagD (HAD superfamily)
VRALNARAQRLSEPSKLLESVDVFIFDCDGVIWRGDSVIEGVPAVLDALRRVSQ